MCDSKSDYDGDYNPFEHRVVKKPNSDLRTFINLTKASLGLGVFAMPQAFQSAGWGLGVIGTLFIGFICAHCVHIFIETSRGCCRVEMKPTLSYSETCRATLANGPKVFRPYANAAGVFAELAMFLTYIGVCCILILIMAETTKKSTAEFFPTMNYPVEYFCIMFLIPLCLMCQIRYLKWLAPFSMLANVLVLITFSICVYYIAKGSVSYQDKPFVGEPSKIPAFMSTVLFAMEGIGVVIPIENSMKKPQHFSGCPSVLMFCMMLIVISYSTLGLFGYLRYGDEIKDLIVLSLPAKEWPAEFARSSIVVLIFFTFPLHFYVVIDIFTKLSSKFIEKKYKNITQIIARTLFVLISGTIAVSLPMLSQVIRITGALFYSILGIIVPAAMETIFRWDECKKYNFMFYKNVFLICYGFFTLISGCTFAIVEIYEIINKETV